MSAEDKFKKVFKAMDEIFSTIALPVREIELIQDQPPEIGPDYFAQEITIKVKLDSRPIKDGGSLK